MGKRIKPQVPKEELEDATQSNSSIVLEVEEPKSLDLKKEANKIMANKRFEEKQKEEKGRRPSKPNRGYKPVKKNDPSWYSRNPQLTKDTTNLPFSWKNGLVLSGATKTNGSWQFKNNFEVPSVICYNYHPILGVNNSKNSLNTIANNLYSYVRYVNSGSRNYEAPDLFMYCGAIAGVYTLLAFIAKCIGLSNVASTVNRAYPRQIFDAMAINYDDVIEHIADYRGQLNRLIVRANAYNVPVKFYIYSAHAWLASTVLIESENNKDALYTAKPLTVLKFDANSMSTGSSLVPVLIDPSNTKLLSTYLAVARDIITALETDEDIGIISGDILKAMGADNCFHMGTVSEDFVVLPQFDETMLWKLKNARILPQLMTSNGSRLSYQPVGVEHTDITKYSLVSGMNNADPWYFQVSQGLNAALQISTCIGFATSSSGDDTTLTAMEYCNLNPGLLDTKSLNPTEDEVNEDLSMRFITFRNTGRSLTNYVVNEIECANMAIIQDTTIVQYDSAQSAWVPALNISFEVGAQLTVAELQQCLFVENFFRAFKYAHGFVYFGSFTSPTNPTIYGQRYVGDFTNVHVLTDEEVANIIDAQLLSEYAIPAVEHLGKAQSFAK